MRILGGVGVLATYAALVIWLTWPLAVKATTHFPVPMTTARTDALLAMWAAAHETRALLSRTAVLADAGIYHPTPNSLYYAEAGFGALPLFAPVLLASGNPVLAMNVVFLLGVVLTAAAIHAVTVRWTDSHSAGLVAGISFVTTPWVLWTWMPIAPNFAVIFYLPFIVMVAAPLAWTWVRTAGLGMLIALQALTSPYLAAAAGAPLAMLAGIRCLRRSTRRAGVHVAAALAVACVLATPAFWGYVRVERENPSLEWQSTYPTVRFHETVLPAGLFSSLEPTALSMVAWALILVGLVVRATRSEAPGAERRNEGWRHAGWWTIAGMCLSLTPHVRIGGMRIALPHVLIAPVYAMLRAPGRMGVAMLVAGSILAGVAFAECAARLSGRWTAVGRRVGAGVVVAVALLTYFAPTSGISRQLDPRASYPMALPPDGDDRIQRVIAQFDGALLELPVSPDALPHASAMYRAIRHRRPLLNGYSSYYPAEFPARMALACRLPDPDALADLVRTTDVGTILVHTRMLEGARRMRALPPYGCEPPPDGPAPRGAEMKSWWDAGAPGARADLRLVAQTFEGDLLFRVVRP